MRKVQDEDIHASLEDTVMTQKEEAVGQEEKKTIYNMPMHTWAVVAENVSVFRVPGGWIYDILDNGLQTRTFIAKPTFSKKVVKGVEPEDLKPANPTK